jgi:hypothetical protein
MKCDWMRLQKRLVFKWSRRPRWSAGFAVLQGRFRRPKREKPLSPSPVGAVYLQDGLHLGEVARASPALTCGVGGESGLRLA